MIQQFSFDFGYPKITFYGLIFSIAIHTFENTYTIDSSNWDVRMISDEELVICGNRLLYAGGQLSKKGSYQLRAKKKRDKVTGIEFNVQMDVPIRGTRLILYNQQQGDIISRVDSTPLSIPKEGITLEYPEAWRSFATPLAIVKGKEQFSFYRSLDDRVSAKRFSFFGDESITVELIYETPGSKVSCECIMPEWEIGYTEDIAVVYKEHGQFIEKTYHLIPWEERRDVPDWLRNISLVVALHGMHFTGYIFNTYSDMLDKLIWLARQIDPKKVLVYVPGFEGRYYWEYGQYDANERLGGRDSLKNLVSQAKEMGYHIFPMLGINIVNTKTENFERFGSHSRFVTVGGVYPVNVVDWDNSRSYDHGWLAYLNPAAKSWQNKLVDESVKLYHTYGFSGIYLDISAMWFNDARYDVTEGTRTLVKRIKEKCDDCVVLGEAWYDGIANVFPLVQNGHTNGIMHYYDEIMPDFFERYCRMFGHLCQGDPGSNSTGVHELGFNSVARMPFKKAVIPTLSMVGDTLEKNLQGVKDIIRDAENYYYQYIKN